MSKTQRNVLVDHSNSPDLITGGPQTAQFLFFYPHIQELEGKILTFIDASTTDPIQRKALKDLIRPTMWEWAYSNNMERQYDIKIKEVIRGQIMTAL